MNYKEAIINTIACQREPSKYKLFYFEADVDPTRDEPSIHGLYIRCIKVITAHLNYLFSFILFA